MKKTYTRPGLVEYGRLDQLTLGDNACDPDNANENSNVTANQNNGQDGSCIVAGGS